MHGLCIVSKYSRRSCLIGFAYHLRKMPVVLPEHLFPFLLEHQHLPKGEEVSAYWAHMAQQNIPWVTEVIKTGCSYIPVYLWGDDAVFNERNEKLVSVVCGSWLENRKNSKDTVYPLFCYRNEPRQYEDNFPCFPGMFRVIITTG